MCLYWFTKQNSLMDRKLLGPEATAGRKNIHLLYKFMTTKSTSHSQLKNPQLICHTPDCEDTVLYVKTLILEWLGLALLTVYYY